MTTAATLESLTDRSKFEHLTTSILRKAEPTYAAVIHTGVNAQGETIVSPVDGLHLVLHSDPPHYVFVQHTTTDRKDLRGKWLSNKDGDLLKATVEVMKIRQMQADAKFTVVLTTNQRLDPQLATDVYQRAQAEQLAVDIWEQSRLADFLDSTADGHWLRKFYLGIEAERLSSDLLHQLGRRSLELYRREVLLPGQGPLVNRGLIEDILANAIPGGPGLCLVTGQSGYGKSVATTQALDKCLSAGALGLWLPARFLQESGDLESAMDAWLRLLHPSLQRDAGRVALDLARKLGRLLLCIDDINRTPEATRLLRVVVGHASPPNSGSGQTEGDGGTLTSADSVCLIVPVWPGQLASLSPNVLDQPWVRIVSVSNLLPTECAEMIQIKLPRLSSIQAREYAARLNHDPFLVGLFTLIAEEHIDVPQLVAVADNVISQFVDEQVREICSRGAIDLLPTELLGVLRNMARQMILRRNLRPIWAELEEWFNEGSKAIRGIRLLIRQEQVCTLGLDDRLDFRHDRLHEWFLVQAMIDLLQLPELDETITAEPFYSAIVGKALAQVELPVVRLASLRTKSPWVVFEAIREVGEPSSQYHEGLFEEAHTWAANDSRSVPESLLTAICWTLVDTNSSRIIPIIDAMEPDPVLMAAGLRNGSAEHGSRFVKSIMHHQFEPGCSNGLRDHIIEHAGDRHGEQIARQLRKQLSLPDLAAKDSNAYLSILGHFQFADFDEQILEVWSRHQDEVLAYAIWAAARCPLHDVSGVLGPLIKRLADLPVREDFTKDLTEREWMTQYIGWGFRKGITPEALSYFLLSVSQDRIPLEDISRMLEGVDHPDSIELVVRHLADGGGSTLWRHLTGIGDNDPEIRMRSPVTTNRLRRIWQSPAEPEKIRTQAFCLWLQTTGCKDAALLATIELDSPFYHYAVQHRIKLGDSSVVPELPQLFRTSKIGWWWWVLAHRVWCEDLRSFASETLANSHTMIPNDFSEETTENLLFFAEFLVKIPVSDGELLLIQNWQHLKFSRWMIHAAFRIGTPTCLDLASEALSLYPSDVNVFKQAFTLIWNQRNSENPITIRHLKGLEPFIDRMCPKEVLHFAWETEQAVGADEDIAAWIQSYLVPRLPNGDQIRVRVTDGFLVAHLDRELMETRFKPDLSYIFRERQGQRLVFPDRQLRLLDGWLSSHRTVRGLAVAAECLKCIGTRRDLEILNRYPIEGDVLEVKRIKTDARFSVCKRTLLE